MKKVFLSIMITLGLISFIVVPVSADYFTTNEHGIGH